MSVTAISSKSAKAGSPRLVTATDVARAPVLLIDADRVRGALLERELLSLGYPVLARLKETGSLLANVERLRPSVIVMGIDLPDSRTLADLACLNQVCPLPVVMFAEQDTPEIIQQTIRAGVSACVVDDIQPERFVSIINVALARFNETQRLRNELESAKGKLEDRKVVDRAKGLLMKERGLTEDEAYTSLRKMAMNKGLTVAAVAKTVVEIFTELGVPAGSAKS